MKKDHIKPTESELNILQILWKNGPSTVRDVNEILNEEREIGYTTTLKFMQIMTEKGLVTRDTNQRTHIYAAMAEEINTKRNLLSSFIKNTFRGSAKQLVMEALGNTQTSKEELQEIKDLIDKLENDQS